MEAIPWLAAFAHSFLLREQDPELVRQRALSERYADRTGEMITELLRADGVVYRTTRLQSFANALVNPIHLKSS